MPHKLSTSGTWGSRVGTPIAVGHDAREGFRSNTCRSNPFPCGCSPCLGYSRSLNSLSQEGALIKQSNTHERLHMEVQRTLSKAFEVSRCLVTCLWFCWFFVFLQRVHGADGDCLQRIRSNAIRSVLLTARTSHRRQWPSFYQDLVAAPLDCRPITTLSKSWERWMTGGYLQITIQEKKNLGVILRDVTDKWPYSFIPAPPSEEL